MDYKDFSAMVTDIVNDMIYIADIKTYKLLYLNRAALEALGNPSVGEWLGQPCYRVLQNASQPCAFCTNHLLKYDVFYVWEHYNPVIHRHCSVRDKLIDYNGTPARLEVAVDISEQALVQKKLEDKLQAEETLVACIQTLYKRKNIATAIDSLLETIGKYHQAERAYIFEVDYEKNLCINTYEWCAQGVVSQIERRKALPLATTAGWFRLMEANSEIYLENPTTATGKEWAPFEILEEQGIHAIMVAPLFDEENRIIGLLGVDNPQEYTDNTSLLRSVAAFIVDDLNKRTAEERLMQRSFVDALTGAENHHSFVQKIKMIEATPPKYLGVVYVDINGLKILNDSLGSVYGDQQIIYVAETLQEIFSRPIYRIAGDAFVVLCTDVDKRSFDKMVQQLRKQSKEDMGLGISVGASWKSTKMQAVTQMQEAESLMHQERQKLYGAKTEGRGKYPAAVLRTLRSHIEQQKFFFHLQPQVDFATKAVVGAEALVRRIGEDGAMELPEKFLSAYEKEGGIHLIDFYIFEEVCKVLQQWQNQGNAKPMAISVNIARATLLETDVVQRFLGICEAYGVSPSSITIEVSQSIGTIEQERLKALMEAFVGAGFSIALDDFGAKSSDVQLLSLVDFQAIKIDEVLVHTLEANEKSRVITKHTIAMCQCLGFDVCLAEGIETKEQYDLLKSYGCTLGQGHYFEKPLSVEAFTKKYILK